MKQKGVRSRLIRTLLILMLVLTAVQALDTTAFADVKGNVVQSSAGKWKKVKGGKYTFVLKDGTKVVSSWIKSGSKLYYVNAKGYRLTGMQKAEGTYYFFNKKGIKKSGWQTVKGKKLYFDPAHDGARASGFVKVGKYTYYFKNGKYQKGWLKLSGKAYYLKSNGRMAKGWLTIKGKKYYFNKKTGERVSGTVVIGGKQYQFKSNGVLIQSTYDSSATFVDSSGHKLRRSTVKNLLKTALQPVGTTMYVWGGGWNIADSGSGTETVTIGLSPQWKAFYQKQTSSYDYRKTRYQVHDGLDCAGYVGWVIYNTFNTTSGNAGYVMPAEKMARTFAGYGWGSYTPASSVSDYKAGDIMSTASGHVYIVVGSCSDGSVVLLHSSPKGVMISGTTTRSGSKSSQAISLAKKYMKKYYPKWYAKYPEVDRGSSYLTSYARMRWYLGTSKSVLSDPDGYTGKNAAAVLKDLLGDI